MAHRDIRKNVFFRKKLNFLFRSSANSVSFLPLRASLVFFFVYAFSPIFGQTWKDDFFYSIEVNASAEHSLQEIVLPDSVYENSMTRELKDLRVFNGAGEMVPFRLERNLQPEEEQIRTRHLLIAVAGSQNVSSDQIRVLLQNRSGSASIEMSGGGSSDSVSRFYAKLDESDGRMGSLKFNWKPFPKNFIEKINIEGSNNLVSWNPLVTDQILAQIGTGKEQILQDEILLQGEVPHFLRVSFDEGAEPVILSDFTLTRSRNNITIESKEKTIRAISTARYSAWDVSSDSDQILYDTGGYFPVESVVFRLQSENVSFPVRISGKDFAKSPWIECGTGVIHRLRLAGETVSRSTVHTDPSCGRYLRVTIADRPVALGKEIPQLSILYTPTTLTFLARGEGPFRLAYGNPDLIEMPVPERGEWDREWSTFSAETQNPVSGNRNPPRSEVNATPFLLWGVLLGGVLLLTWMALSLTREK